MQASYSSCSGCGCGCGVVSVVDTSGPGVVGVGEGLSAGGDGTGDAADTGVSMEGYKKYKITYSHHQTCSDRPKEFHSIQLFFGPSVFASSIVNIIFLLVR